MKTIHLQRDQVINTITFDYSLLDCIKLTPFTLKPTISNQPLPSKKIKAEIISYYCTILFHEIAFKKALKDNKYDTYQTLFETYNFSYTFYCKALKNTHRLIYISIDLNYFKQLYQNQSKTIAFNPLKENLLLTLSPNNEPKQIILS